MLPLVFFKIVLSNELSSFKCGFYKRAVFDPMWKGHGRERQS